MQQYQSAVHGTEELAWSVYQIFCRTAASSLQSTHKATGLFRIRVLLYQKSVDGLKVMEQRLGRIVQLTEILLHCSTSLQSMAQSHWLVQNYSSATSVGRQYKSDGIELSKNCQAHRNSAALHLYHSSGNSTELLLTLSL